MSVCEGRTEEDTLLETILGNEATGMDDPSRLGEDGQPQSWGDGRRY